MPLLVMRGGRTKVTRAHVVPKKGVEGYAAARVKKNVELLGIKGSF